MCSVLCTVQWIVHCAVYCALCSVLCTVQWIVHCAVYFALCSVLCTVQWIVQCAVYCALCSELCTVQCMVHCAVYCALCSVFCSVKCIFHCALVQCILHCAVYYALCTAIVHPAGYNTVLYLSLQNVYAVLGIVTNWKKKKYLNRRESNQWQEQNGKEKASLQKTLKLSFYVSVLYQLLEASAGYCLTSVFNTNSPIPTY